MLRRFKKMELPWSELPNKVAIHLNDTHPSISIPEMMRLLMDEELLGWEEAWDLTKRVFSFTNHTILPEAVEKWRYDMMSNLLPRHVEIICEMNRRHLVEVAEKFPDEPDRLRRMSIIEESDQKFIRMLYIAVIGSHGVNGYFFLLCVLLTI